MVLSLIAFRTPAGTGGRRHPIDRNHDHRRHLLRRPEAGRGCRAGLSSVWGLAAPDRAGARAPSSWSTCTGRSLFWINLPIGHRGDRDPGDLSARAASRPRRHHIDYRRVRFAGLLGVGAIMMVVVQAESLDGPRHRGAPDRRARSPLILLVVNERRSREPIVPFSTPCATGSSPPAVSAASPIGAAADLRGRLSADLCGRGRHGPQPDHHRHRHRGPLGGLGARPAIMAGRLMVRTLLSVDRRSGARLALISGCAILIALDESNSLTWGE